MYFAQLSMRCLNRSPQARSERVLSQADCLHLIRYVDSDSSLVTTVRGVAYRWSGPRSCRRLGSWPHLPFRALPVQEKQMVLLNENTEHASDFHLALQEVRPDPTQHCLCCTATVASRVLRCSSFLATFACCHR